MQSSTIFITTGLLMSLYSVYSSIYEYYTSYEITPYLDYTYLIMNKNIVFFDTEFSYIVIGFMFMFAGLGIELKHRVETIEKLLIGNAKTRTYNKASTNGLKHPLNRK